MDKLLYDFLHWRARLALLDRAMLLRAGDPDMDFAIAWANEVIATNDRYRAQRGMTSQQRLPLHYFNRN